MLHTLKLEKKCDVRIDHYVKVKIRVNRICDDLMEAERKAKAR